MAHDLDDHAFVDRQALARTGFVGDQAQVGGDVALVDRHAALGEPVAQAGGQGLAAHHGLAQAADVDAVGLDLFDKDAQEAGRAGVGLWLEVGDGLKLLFGLAGVAGNTEQSTAWAPDSRMKVPGVMW
jgi:hypothetical protein